MMHEKTKLLNLTSDVIFKNFFMNENTIEYTAEFINLITGIPKEEIMKKAVFENIELPIINKNSKRYKCDIIIGIAKQLINLEMNASYYEGIIEKNNSYLFRMLGDRFNKGENYIDGKKIIRINIDNYGGKSLHNQSHGESFLSLVQNRFRGNGFYILDEPEAALSPMRQLTLLIEINNLVKNNSQFIIATHSPILLAYPDAQIYNLDSGIERIEYAETEQYKMTKNFLDNPNIFIERLFDSDFSTD